MLLKYRILRSPDDFSGEGTQTEAAPESTNHLQEATRTAEAEITGQSGADGKTQTPTQIQNSASNLADLDKDGKFVYQGKVYTAKELKELREGQLRDQDYRNKTKALADERKNEDKVRSNFAADLEKVRAHPALMLQFRNIYPAHYHDLAMRLLQSSNHQKTQENQGGLDPRVLEQLSEPMSRMEKLLSDYQEREVAANDSMLQGYAAKFEAKYPLAQENEVLAKAEILLQQKIDAGEKNVNIDEATWEQLWKASHSYHDGRYKTYYQKQVTDQSKANKTARDTPKGGSSAARPVQKESLKSARENMEAELVRMRSG